MKEAASSDVGRSQVESLKRLHTPVTQSIYINTAQAWPDVSVMLGSQSGQDLGRWTHSNSFKRAGDYEQGFNPLISTVRDKISESA